MKLAFPLACTAFVIIWFTLLLTVGPAKSDSNPTLTVTTAPSTVTLDWTGVPSGNGQVVKFTFVTRSPCQYGCEVLVPNTGTDTESYTPTAGNRVGFSICSADVDPQVCTPIVWAAP